MGPWLKLSAANWGQDGFFLGRPEVILEPIEIDRGLEELS